MANAKTSEEICIPRRFVGEVSSIEAPFRIVGLVKELEYREGVVLPHRRSVIEMPRAVNDFSRSSLRPALYPRPAGVVAIRAEPDSESRFWRVLRGSVAAGIPGLPRGDLRGPRCAPGDGLRLDLRRRRACRI